MMMSEGTRWPAHLAARTAIERPLDDRRSRVPGREAELPHSGSEERDHGRLDCGGEVHDAGVAGDRDPCPLELRRGAREIELPRGAGALTPGEAGEPVPC